MAGFHIYFSSISIGLASKTKNLYTNNGTDVLKMVLKNQKWDKIAELFFEHPNRKFSVREIAKTTGIPASSVQRYLERLRKEGFITAENMPVLNSYFKFIKAFFLIKRLLEVGAVDYLEEKFNASAIIVFGSARKGEYDRDSDIDIFVESTRNPDIDLSKFEKKLGHRIQLFVKNGIKDLPPNLFNNVINGIKLRGYFKLI